MNPVSYIRETIVELKKVTWPNRQTTLKLTGIVIGISAIVAIYVGGLDYLFTNILTLIVNR
ncbi:preprotein translocase subunit SecE [Candidatus Woesebacteria bacterium]|nr:preprotein translocase subunit SecE [Candidatus Woesebacteria bacterium]